MAGSEVRLDLREIAKPGGGTRVLTVLDAHGARRYAELTSPLADRLACRRRVPFALDLSAPLVGERARWRRAVAAATGGRPSVRSDVRDCYASITPFAIRIGLRSMAVDPMRVEAIETFFHRLYRSGAPGLPVGPAPSAILAEVVLSLADREVLRAGATIVRWVDDVVIAGPDRRTTLRAFDAWREGLSRLGLSPHEGKTSFDAPAPTPWMPSGSRPCERDMMRAP